MRRYSAKQWLFISRCGVRQLSLERSRARADAPRRPADTRKELSKRIGLFISAGALAGAFSGLISYGVAKIQTEKIEQYTILFLIEGLPSFLLAVVVYFCLPSRPEQSKYLNEEERTIACTRLNADQQGGEVPGIDWKAVRYTLLNWRTCASSSPSSLSPSSFLLHSRPTPLLLLRRRRCRRLLGHEPRPRLRLWLPPDDRQGASSLDLVLHARRPLLTLAFSLAGSRLLKRRRAALHRPALRRRPRRQCVRPPFLV